MAVRGECEFCGWVGWIGQRCEGCRHTTGVPRSACACEQCCDSGKNCPECGGTGQREGWFFGSGFCVRCNGTGEL